jgi:hypothetical protein
MYFQMQPREKRKNLKHERIETLETVMKYSPSDGSKLTDHLGENFNTDLCFKNLFFALTALASVMVG